MVGDRRSIVGTGEGSLVLGSQRNNCGCLCGEKEAGAMTVQMERWPWVGMLCAEVDREGYV